MAEWWSIEVFSGDKLSASAWRYAYEDELTEAAITHGALYYEWHDTEYGVIVEMLFARDAQWEAFRALPAVRAALDAVPDPVIGLLIYRGRGGAAGVRTPRKPRPAPGAAALELEEPRERRRIKQVKVARQLRYNGGGTGLEELRRELGAPGADGPGTDVPGTDVPDPESVLRGMKAFDRFDD